MPIRFFCVYCNAQLGIATRKAGSVVSCPTCKKQLRVPTPEEDPESFDGANTPPPGTLLAPGIQATSHDPVPLSPNAPKGAKLFEQGDISKILHAPEPIRPNPIAPGNMGAPKTRPLPEGQPTIPQYTGPTRPLHVTSPARKGLIILTRTRAVVFVLIGILFMFGSFVGGVYFGKSLTKPEPSYTPTPVDPKK